MSPDPSAASVPAGEPLMRHGLGHSPTLRAFSTAAARSSEWSKTNLNLPLDIRAVASHN